MLCDHMGLLLFPDIPVFRYVGRIAMPLFAFFIGEGCRYTRNRRRYFLQLAGLAVFCQAVYAGEALFSGGGISVYSEFWYFNILFTFALASVGCFLLCDVKNGAAKQRKKETAVSCARFALWAVCVSALTYFAWRKRTDAGWTLCFDYGISGLLLPLSAVLFDAPRKKRFAFLLALLLYCFIFAAHTDYVWFSLLSFPLILLYNGKGGSKKLKPVFYIFYPAHLGILYLIAMLAGF